MKKANPMILAAKKRLAAQDPMKRRGRAYGLGERNPATLPGSGKDAESIFENDEGTRYWTQLGKKVRAGARLNKHLP